MIVRDFIGWLEKASTAQRSEAAHALARAYLYADVDRAARERMEVSLTILLDDPSPLVRFALADALGGSPDAPRNVVLSLLEDREDIAVEVASRSPVLLDGELVDLVATMSVPLQEAIASRPAVEPSVAAALAELGGVTCCRILIENGGAAIMPVTLSRLAARHGGDPDIRSLLLERDDLPVAVRNGLLRDLGHALGVLVSQRRWLGDDRADEVVRDACDDATVAIAAETAEEHLSALAEHLRGTGQLTTSLLLRALCAGNLSFFAAALSILSGVPEGRVRSLVHDGREGPLKAVYGRAGLPPSAFGAFASALAACREYDLPSDPAPQMSRRIVDDVLARQEMKSDGPIGDLATMLRRFAAEATRAAAREFVRSATRAA
ncbi:MAG: DUF2336 domain-containing protein [Bauldia sp.]|nr:DUF2336 domain-containing protein [Bauldia sp.]